MFDKRKHCYTKVTQKGHPRMAEYWMSFFCVVRLAAHVSNGLKSRIRPVVGRI